MTHLTIDTALLPAYAELRLLLRAEPVTDVTFAVGNVAPRAAVAVRTLLPFPLPVRVNVARSWAPDAGPQGAFLAALLSAPVMASATELTLGAVSPGRTAAPLVDWLAKSPFLSGVRSLSLPSNGFTSVDADRLARLPNLRNVQRLNVTKNLIGEGGVAVLRTHFGDGLVI